MPLLKRQEVVKWKEGEARAIEDDVVVETSLDIAVNGREVITLLCSPENRKNLATGFLKSEGIIDKYEQIQKINLEKSKKRINVHLTKGSGDLESYFNKKRALASSSGRANLVFDEVVKLESVAEGTPVSDPTNLSRLMSDMQSRAGLFRQTGGSHTAALANDKRLLYLAEDIGRHNATDKVIGKALIRDEALKNKIMLTSGRLSAEMVLKSIRSSIPILVSRSAPTTMGINLAREANLTLVGFTRGNRMTFYSAGERVLRD
ncbi:formate dehydrogenase accessory sulfurtransferase FdhD [Candidatus Bipolaricaulota bacterium]|nr:formate dehydrogenase accessory sulfurtransferase FdhD [Candidatus Bipolaricaulota bacterium]MBS3813942.1 formate dehydrogenase accessory sulfurtransferase FdhD [Candidatus Bipolaricaulota bacterium]